MIRRALTNTGWLMGARGINAVLSLGYLALATRSLGLEGFGNFVLRDKRQRQGRNPQTGEPITITERRVLNFKASQLLKQALNGAEGGAPAGSEAAAAKDG